MTRTVTAFFDSRAEAEAARSRLSQSNIDADSIKIIDQSHANSSGEGGSSGGQGFWSSLKEAFMPEEDSHAYEEGMRRGGYLLCAEVNEQQADQAIRLLDEGGSVDFDQRQEQWRSEGWAGLTGAAGTSGNPAHATGNVVAEEHIPIVEEELRVGKREVARGGARVRSYVREIPVHEQVSLRDEHVSVERRPVDQPVSAAELNSGDLLRDRTVEMIETDEEAVVAKEARVREEVVVRKTAEQHVEEINATVRRTEVDVDEGAGSGGQDRSAFGFQGSAGSAGQSGGLGTGATGYESRDPEPEGTGYTDRIDKSGF